MQIETISTCPSEWNADLLVVILDANTKLCNLEDEVLEARLTELQGEYVSGGRDCEFVFEPRHREQIGAVVAYSTAQMKGVSLWEAAKTFAARAIKFASKTKRNRVVFALNTPEAAELVSKVAEGALLGTLTFNRYKKDNTDKYADVVMQVAVGDAEAADEAIQLGQIFANATNDARNLVSEPGDVITPDTFAGIAEQLCTKYGMQFELWDEARLANEGFLGHVKVGGGSMYPPRMFTLTYEPAEPSNVHLAIVGKGLTFDTGGICIKPAARMYEMKGDMGGAAAVVGAMQVIAQLHPAIKVTGIVVSAENFPGPGAMRPGDVIVYKNGKSVHVENTDAEGRLVLADGLIRAGEIEATHIVDIATLTGGCVRALGESFIGLMGTNRSLINAITQAGGTHGESCWKLPLPLEYAEMLKCPFADMTNSADPLAAATTAGLFLKEFVPENAAWAHMDIAGPSWRSKDWKYYIAGPTGVGVHTLAELACNWDTYVK